MSKFPVLEWLFLRLDKAALRMHSGGEVPAILQVGERVLSVKDSRWMDDFKTLLGRVVSQQQAPIPVKVESGVQASITIKNEFNTTVRDDEDLKQIKKDVEETQTALQYILNGLIKFKSSSFSYQEGH
jgi:hypothetical protein